MPNPVREPPAWLRGGLLALLPLLVVALYVTGQNYDPGLLAFKSEEGAGGGLAAKLTQSPPPGLAVMGAPRAYDKTNLYEYIDGHADAFISAGFQSLTVADYAVDANAPAPDLTADIYHMGTPLQAFGIMMAEVTPDSQSVTMGQMGFVSGGVGLFLHGPYFVRLGAQGPNAANMDFPAAASAVVAALGEADAGKLRELFAFPDLGKVVRTNYVKQDYRGLSFFKGVIDREFERADGGVLTLFLMQGAPAAMTELERALTVYAQEEGLTPQITSESSAKLIVFQDPYEGDWFVYLTTTRAWGGFAKADAALLDPIRQLANELPPFTPAGEKSP
ncbi:DUF6599 family protein [Magnetofaba australis]|uniref:Uncharacterized protein n=1 Tax=Magnetofaba australis IT-1 TaxID=1434232 RepID=A0A1Y2K5X2_9PROT|nr:DUF6599 family protein [Magnetofaba australis]OSM04424.1 hypothetical protein MAIT1_04338 [Magnetofaba australis IT-1]